MRWQLVLQTTVGLGVLFWFGREASDRYVAPSVRVLAETSAQTSARSAVDRLTVEWISARDSLRTLLEAEISSPHLASATNGSTAPEGGAGDSLRLKAALDSLLSQAGGGASAAAFDRQGKALASSGPNESEIVALGAPKLIPPDRVASVRFERLGDGLFVLAVGGVHAWGDGSLVLAIPLNEATLQRWGVGTGSSGYVSLSYAGKSAVTTLPTRVRSDAEVFRKEGMVRLGEATFSQTSGRLTDDVGTVVETFGYGTVDESAIAGAVTGAQLLISFLGALSLALMLLLLLVAPKPAPELIEVPAESLPEDEVPPLRRGKAPAEDLSMGAKAPPAARMPAAPVPAPVPQVQVAASQVFESFEGIGEDDDEMMGGLSGAGVEQPLELPDDALVAVEESPSLGADLFSAMDQAAFSAAPPRPQAFLGHQVDPAEDLPAPKGGMPLGVPPSAAAQSPSTDLPVPKGGFPPGFAPNPDSSLAASRSSSRVNPHREVLPPLSQTPPLPANELLSAAAPAAPAAVPVFPGDLPGASSPPAAHAVEHVAPPTPSAAHVAGQYRGAGVGESISVPSSRARSSASGQPLPGLSEHASDAIALPGSGTEARRGEDAIALPGSVPQAEAPRAPAPGLPAAFDETHYRYVYNEFIASKARLGESVDDVSFEGFSLRLRNSEQELIHRHGCRAVRFQVLVKDRTVSLRPQLVR